MSENQTDSEAITASLSDPGAFAAIFERHFWAIHDYLRRRLDRELADELASQTFLIAFDRRIVFDPCSAGSRPWLFGIATNLIREHRRSELRELRIMAELTPDRVFGIDGVESRVDAVRMRGQLAAALADLPGEEADVLLLLVWAELGQPEIAEALSVPLGTVKSRLSRARGRLRTALASSIPAPTSTIPNPDRR